MTVEDRGLPYLTGPIAPVRRSVVRFQPRTGPLLEGIHPSSSFVPLVVTGVVAGSSLLACLLPALRAARVDPTVPLKAD